MSNPIDALVRERRVIGAARVLREALAAAGIDPGGRAACAMVRAACESETLAAIEQRYQERKALETRAARAGVHFNDYANATDEDLTSLVAATETVS